MRLRTSCLAILLSLLAASTSYAGIRPLLPGESIIYQTVQSGSQYRTNFSQITGNAYTELGDEVKIDPGVPNKRYVTNIAVGTQTFDSAPTPAYMDGVQSSGSGVPDAGGFLELTLYLNDGPPDSSSNDPFVEGPPTGQLSPGTVLYRSRIPTPVYPAGGVSRSANGLNDPNNAADNAADPWILNFPFPNILVPDIFSFALVNLDANGVPDGYNFDGNQFGLWHGAAQIGTPGAPGSGLGGAPPVMPANPFYYGTVYNTNLVGTSRTGANINRLTNNGQWEWLEYNGPRNSPTPWESDRDSNNAVEATIYAMETVPEPSTFVLGGLGLVGLIQVARRRRR